MNYKHYSLHLRKTKRGKKIYYAQFRNPDGSWGTAKSTGVVATTDQPMKGRRKSQCLLEAEAWAESKLAGGNQVVKRENITFQEFAGNDFFAYGGRWEMARRFSKKKTPSKSWCIGKNEMLTNHVLPNFGNFRLTLIDEVTIENFVASYMSEGYSKSYIDKILGCIKAILQDAYKQRLIPRIPTIELSGGDERRRGKLTIEEVEKIFSIKWEDERAFLFNLIAMSTGMRLSEIQALKINDINPLDGTFIINKVWERRVREIKNRTKNGQDRPGRIPDSVLELVNDFRARHPYKNNPEAFLFYSTKMINKPATPKILVEPLYAIMDKLNINWKERSICFHSWRYYANSALIEAGIPAETVRALIGHTKDAEDMTQRYYRAENLNIGVEAIKKAIPKNLKFNADTNDGDDEKLH
jgi:integrase